MSGPTPVKSAEQLALDDASTFKMEARIGQTLRIGVNASSLSLGAGLMLSLFSHYQVIADWLMAAGLIMLMATPIARVFATVVEYARKRDWTFFILTSIVLAELLTGIGAALILHRRF